MWIILKNKINEKNRINQKKIEKIRKKKIKRDFDSFLKYKK